MNGILKELCGLALERTRRESALVPLSELKMQAKDIKGRGYAFANALRAPGLSVIAEVKKASPSKGVIDGQFDYLAIAHDYEAGG
ncbi:MAG TPA: indole-3-glycerol-phosphate synthase TrpC, partial [Candidatus Coproplasma avicola]|nr:indole-3-glycerol-phosphate synthase TrpC [Candidatus Coproplasma avicola]